MIEGYITRANKFEIGGWVYDSEKLNETLAVDIFIDGNIIKKEIEANIFRGDVLSSGRGTGKYGFQIDISDLQINDNYLLNINVSNSTIALSNSPMEVVSDYQEIERDALRESFSQNGEDRIIDIIFQFIKMHDSSFQYPTYLDLGSNHPIYDSNTYLFYKKGSKGLIIDADPRLIQLSKKVRINDHAINAGIVPKKDQAITNMDFYKFNMDTWSTFSEKRADDIIKSGMSSLIETISVPVYTINEIIEEHFETVPDLLSIDVESLDFEVLMSLNMHKYKPKIICIETGKDKKSIRDYMLQNDYELYGSTYINDIFVRNDYFKLIG